MEEANKLPLRRVEFSLTKFNEVAIPHHLDLLRQHRANIIKYGEYEDYVRLRAEHTNARRVVAQLRSLLAEMDSLRRQVKKEDWPKFDKLTYKSRDLTLAAIMDYLESMPTAIKQRSSENTVAGSVVSTDSVGVVAHTMHERDSSEEPEPLIQLQVDDQEMALREREAVLQSWTELQGEVHALHDIWRQVHDTAQVQKEQVETMASNVNVADENVQVARTHLLSAERLRVGAYGAGGAVVGALVGGPVGLVLGAKAGAAAVLAGSALGFIGARFLGIRRQREIDETEHNKDQ